jgi:hypothetical protein
MLNKLRRPMTLLVAFSIITGIIGCLEIPLGDPEKSQVDTQYTGLWKLNGTGADKSDLISIIPYDSRTYVVADMQFTQDAQNNPTSKSELIYKMWLTHIADTTFATLEPKDPAMFLHPSDKSFVVLKLTRQANVITAQVVEDKLVKQASITTPEALEKLITSNLNNPDLYGEKVQFTLLPPEDAKPILAVFNHDN